jgi:hypothetical protein
MPTLTRQQKITLGEMRSTGQVPEHRIYDEAIERAAEIMS